MRKIVLLMGIAVLHVALVADVRGDVGVVESTGALFLDGASTSYLSTVGGGDNPRWSGSNLGEFDVTAGDTLALTNFYFENYAYNGGSIPPGGQYNDNWLDGSSTATFKLFRDNSLLYEQAMRQSAVSGNNRDWDLAASGVNVNLLAGLTTQGSHSLSWTIDWSYNQWSGTAVVVGSTQSTSGGGATFAVVPEPSVFAFMAVAGGAGALAFWRRRAG
jgi:hypothetical protein